MTRIRNLNPRSLSTHDLFFLNMNGISTFLLFNVHTLFINTLLAFRHIPESIFKFTACFAKLNRLVKSSLVSKSLPVLFRIRRWMTTLQSPGRSARRTEARGAQACKLTEPEAAEPPESTYACAAESLHAAKRKEKKIYMNGREIQQQHYKEGGGRDTIHKQKSYIKSLHSKGMRQEGSQTIISVRLAFHKQSSS